LAIELAKGRYWIPKTLFDGPGGREEGKEIAPVDEMEDNLLSWRLVSLG